MQHGKWYGFAERCVVRGKPANTVKVSLRGGYFVKETKASFVFDGFRVKKSVILEICEESKELRNLVEHLESLLN